jgi:cytochrome bd-type quinol oxidase subunit 2
MGSVVMIPIILTYMAYAYRTFAEHIGIAAPEDLAFHMKGQDPS